MKRQAIDSGSWFDLDAASSFLESTDWDGRNEISCATGSQWDHETLYLTKKGKWVLNSYSAWQGSSESWEIVTDGVAADWLIQNRRQIPSILDNEVASHEI